MKRRFFVLFAVVILALALTACGKVSQTEEAIAAIGEVTMDSLKKIENAEKFYGTLRDNQQSKVENAGTLEEARQEYDRLEKLIADTKDALEALEPITPESGDALEKARGLVEALTEDNLTDYVEDAEKTLKAAEKKYGRQCKLIQEYEDALEAIGTVTLGKRAAIEKAEEAYSSLVKNDLDQYVSDEALAAAREQYDVLYLQSRYAEIIELYGQREYETVIREIRALNKEYPDHDHEAELHLLDAYCHIALAETAFKDGRMQDALSQLDQAKEYGSGTQEYSNLQTKIDNKIQSNRPKNGKILYNRAGSGYSKLTIEAGRVDVCVKLESVENPDKYILFYVHANSQATVSVPSGEYYFKYTYGNIWYSDTEMFGANAGYSQSDDTLTFTVSYSGNYVYYSDMTITLYSVIGGNFDTEDIEADEF